MPTDSWISLLAKVDAARIMNQIDQFGEIGRIAAGGAAEGIVGTVGVIKAYPGQLTLFPVGLKLTLTYAVSIHMTEATEAEMIFVPSIKGISHDPRESTTPEDIELGTRVLLTTLLHLAA